MKNFPLDVIRDQDAIGRQRAHQVDRNSTKVTIWGLDFAVAPIAVNKLVAIPNASSAVRYEVASIFQEVQWLDQPLRPVCSPSPWRNAPPSPRLRPVIGPCLLVPVNQLSEKATCK